jgi:hypothetical protein
MGHGDVQLRVDLNVGSDADAADLEQDTLQLREELLQLDVSDVQRPPGDAAPEGAKGIDVGLLGTLIVTSSQEALGAIIRAVAGFITRSANRSVKLQLGEDVIELTGSSRADQERLLEAFLARHATESS